MSLLAAVRRSASRLVAGSVCPPSLSVVRATRAVDAAHADGCRAWDSLFARGTPTTMDGAESELMLAQYFYGLASTALGRASAAKATREVVSDSLRAASSDMMDGSTAVLRAAACIPGDPSTMLRDGASSYVEGASNLLRASETAGDHSAFFLDAAAGKIGAAATIYNAAVLKINAEYVSPASPPGSPADWELLDEINVECQAAKEAKEKVELALENFPFEIKEKHQCSDLILTRTYLDEEIEVVVSGPFTTSDNPVTSGGDEAKSVLALQVTITKGSSLTMFTCSAFASELRVNTMYLRTTIGDEEKEEHDIAFEGSESNQMLQWLVWKYLELRGVSVMTAAFLHRLLTNKGVFANMLWLDMLKGFVTQSK